jgi:cell division septum initiation protein DivIVA
MKAISCPICGKLDKPNRQFLKKLADDGKISSAISLLKIVWDNFPSLRLTADSKVIIQGLSKAVLKDLREEAKEIITQVKTFIDAVRPSIQELPENIRKDLEEKFNALQNAAPTFTSIAEAITTITDAMEKKVDDVTHKIEETNAEQIEKLKLGFTKELKAALEEAGFPEPEQMKLLSELVPRAVPLLEKLVGEQKDPNSSGNKGELELFDELNDYYPDDIHERFGGPGDTDIVSKPRYNGTILEPILTESKKNGRSGWRRSYIEQVQRHMKNRSIRLAILAVETMPKGSNGYIIEHCSEGVVWVTNRENYIVAYGALRSILLGLHPFQRKTIDPCKVLADKRIDEPIRAAYKYVDYVKRIRQKTRKIPTLARGIDRDVDELDALLRQCFKEFQTRIEEAIMQIEAENN